MGCDVTYDTFIKDEFWKVGQFEFGAYFYEEEVRTFINDGPGDLICVFEDNGDFNKNYPHNTSLELIKKEIKETLIESLDNYKTKIQKIMDEVLNG